MLKVNGFISGTVTAARKKEKTRGGGERREREREREAPSFRIISRHYSPKKTSPIKKGQADLATAASLLKAT